MNKKLCLLVICINEMPAEDSNIIVIFKIDLGLHVFRFALLPSRRVQSLTM